MPVLSVRVLLFVLLSVSPGAQSVPASRPAPDPAITARIEAIRARRQVPALAGAVVTRDRIEGVWATGLRAAGGDDLVTVDDRWHVGSCTKSVTATLIALLVERGDLAWDRKLPELLPELRDTLHADYADLTLVEFLAHRAGLAANGPDQALARCARLPGTTGAQRREFVRRVLAAPPAVAPRTQQLYSNAGFVVAGHIAERATGKAWEDLVRELLFTPLGMTSAGFGAPGTAGTHDQPRGHDVAGTPIEPGPAADNPPLLGPAGTCHMTLADWAKYLQLHLRGQQGDVQVGAVTLRRATFARLHTAYAGTPPYGYGWALPRRAWAAGDQLVLTHNGSNTMWFCVCWLDPVAGFGVLAATNIAGPKAERATDDVCALLLERGRTARPASRPGAGAGR